MGLILPRDIKGKRVALDTSVFIYALEGNENFPHVPELLKSLAVAKSTAFASVLVLTELLTKYYQTGQTGIIADRVGFVTQRVGLVDVSQSVAVRSAELRAKFHLKTPDAIHLTSALESSCQMFFTTDKDFKKVSIGNLKVVILPAKK